MDKTFIRELHVPTIIGILDWERDRFQDILVSVTLYTEPRRSGTLDDISTCVDYSALASKIRAFVEQARRFTIEALADDIAGLCLLLPSVKKVLVRIEKPGAVLNTSSVGVEIERSNS
jgi:FolB domain-containing protein